MRIVASLVGSLLLPSALFGVGCVGDDPVIPHARPGPEADGGAPTEDGGDHAGAAGDAGADADPPTGCDDMKPFGARTLVQGLESPGVGMIRLTLSPDERTAYFSRLQGDAQVMVTASRPDRSAPFGSATELTTNQGKPDLSPSLTDDGLRLYFHHDAGAGRSFDIAFVSRSDAAGVFGVPSPVEGVNSAALDAQPYALDKGRVLYFTSNRGVIGGTPRDRIFKAVETAPETYGAPSPLDLGATEDDDDSAPTVTADERTVYFARRSLQTSGGRVIFVARRESASGNFGTAVPVTELSTGGFLQPTWVSPDGCRLYFASDQADPFVDPAVPQIYVAERPPR